MPVSPLCAPQGPLAGRLAVPASPPSSSPFPQPSPTPSSASSFPQPASAPAASPTLSAVPVQQPAPPTSVSGGNLCTQQTLNHWRTLHTPHAPEARPPCDPAQGVPGRPVRRWL